MKKMLLLGGSHAEIPMIQAAKKMGYYVITTGNQTDGMGHVFADKYISCDYSDKEAIEALAKEQGVEAICSGCNDFAALSAAYACEKLGIPGHDSYETAKKIHHKDQYRNLAVQLNIATPKAKKCRTANEMLKACANMEFPLIVKPVDLTGGKGMTRCNGISQIEEAFSVALSATKKNYVIIEEYVTGSNHGFSAYIQNGKITFYFVDNEQYFHNPYLVSGASTPGDVPENAINQLRNDCEKLAETLKLKDGILHIQFILKEDNKPVIIEVCRRAPGDLYIKFVEMSTGFPYPEYIISSEAGIKMPLPIFHKPDGFYVRHCIMADEEGEIKEVVFDNDIKPYIVEKVLWYKKGDKIEDALKYKAGIVFLHFKTEKEYRKYSNKLTSLMKVIIKRG